MNADDLKNYSSAMRRPCGIQKKLNEYARTVRSYDDIPKAVWAAIAISALTTGGERLAEAETLILEEWAILHANGIIPQKPLKK